MSDEASIEAAQAAIRERVAGGGDTLRRLRPAGMAAVLGAAVLWPVAAPLLGAGAAVGVAGGVLGLLSGPGQTFVNDFLDRMRRSGRSPPEAELRAELERALEDGIGDGSGLREDLGQLLRRVDGVNVALAAAEDGTRRALVDGLAELGQTWREFGWMLADVQERQYEALAMGRQQLDLQREAIVKLNRVLAERERRRARQPPTVPARAPPTDAPEPYMGLHRYEAEDAELYFGRDRLRAELLARVAETPLLALIGDSGSGKSSLLRAGLVRAVWDGVLPGGGEWPVVVLTPTTRPLEELAVRVSAVAGLTPAALLAELRSVPEALVLAARRALVDSRPSRRMLLVVDQLEELYTLGAVEAERAAFLDALLAAAAHPDRPVAVVLAIRGDFLGELAAHPGVPEALRENQLLVGPLSDDDLARTVAGPAEYSGLRVEPELVALVVAEARDARGALPLVSHALLETFHRRSGTTLQARDYVAAGGLQGAIAQTGDRVLAGFTAEQRAIARAVLLRLTSLGERTEDTSLRAPLDELVTDRAHVRAVEDVIDTLVRARLLTSGEDGIEVAHEALIRHWPTLRRWLAEDPEGRRLHRRLAAAAREWEALGRDRGSLYRGSRLSAAAGWLAVHADETNALEREFLDASQRMEADELEAARRRTRRTRAVVVGVVVLLAVVLVAARQVARQSDRADRASGAALRSAAGADSRRLAAAALSGTVGSPDLRRLLALEAYQRSPTPEAHDALVATVESDPRLRATLLGHTAGTAVTNVAFTPDGATIVSAGEDGSVRLWDARNARPRGAPLTGSHDVQGVAVSPDSHWLVVARFDRLEAWELSQDAAPRLRRRVRTRPYSVAAGGGFAITGGHRGAVRLWRLPGLEPAARPLRGLHGAVDAVALSSDGKVAVASDDSESPALAWDVQRPLAPAAIGTGGVVVRDVDMDPAARTVAVARGDDVGVFDAESGAQLARLAGERRALAVAFDVDGGRVAVADGGGLRMLATDGLAALGAPIRAPENPRAIALSPDGRTLASAGADGTVRLRDVGDLRMATGLGPGERVAISRDGRSVAAGLEQGVRVRDAGGLHVLAPGRAPVMALALSGDGRRLAVADAADGVRVWDVDDGVPAGRPMTGDMTRPAVALDGTGRLAAWSEFTRDGDRVHLTAVDAGADRPLPDSDQAVAVLAFSRDGRHVAAGGYDGGVTVWGVSGASTPVRRRVAEEVPVTALAFSPGGSTLAAADGSGHVTLIDLDGKPSGPALDTGDRLVDTLAFSADGGTLATAGRQPVRLWDVRSLEAIGHLPATEAKTQALAFRRDGALVRIDGQGDVRRFEPLLIDDRPDVWRDRVCAMTGRGLTRSEARQWLGGRPHRPACG